MNPEMTNFRALSDSYSWFSKGCLDDIGIRELCKGPINSGDATVCVGMYDMYSIVCVFYILNLCFGRTVDLSTESAFKEVQIREQSKYRLFAWWFLCLITLIIRI